MTPKTSRVSGEVLKLIKKDFGSYEKDEFQKQLSLFESGWVWLVIDKNKLKLLQP